MTVRPLFPLRNGGHIFYTAVSNRRPVPGLDNGHAPWRIFLTSLPSVAAHMRKRLCSGASGTVGAELNQKLHQPVRCLKGVSVMTNLNLTETTVESMTASLLKQGFVPKTKVRGNGMYSNEPINNQELYSHVLNVIAHSLLTDDGAAVIQEKPLLHEIHITHPALLDGYRGTEIIRYLCKQM